MTTTRDIRELIAEEASSSAERHALEDVAERLNDALSQDVPYRPAFKAELRRKLMAQARRQAPPAWYRRPAVIGSAAAMAAAVGILAVGLSLWNPAKTKMTPPSVAVNPPTPSTPGDGAQTTPQLVSSFPDLPRNSLADETLPAGHPGPEPVSLSPGAGVTVYRLTLAPDLSRFTRIASGLKFSAQAVTETDGWSVTEAGRSLRMGKDGHVVYASNTSEGTGATTVDSAGAVAVARQFLLDATLPQSGEPLVMEGNPGGKRMFRVIYTPRAGDRPVINAQTVVMVSERGAVASADAFPLLGEESKGAAPVYTSDEALKQARDRDGKTFEAIDLVYVRTESRSGDWYLQPYWRAFSPQAQGSRFVRYVPALKQ